MAHHCSINVQHHYVKCTPATHCSCPISILDRKQKKWDHSLNLKLWFVAEKTTEGMKGCFNRADEGSCCWCNPQCSSNAARSLTAYAPHQLCRPILRCIYFICILPCRCRAVSVTTSESFFWFCHQMSFLLSVTLRNVSQSVRGVSWVINPDVFYEPSCICFCICNVA